MTPDQYCAERAAKSGSSFYYSFLFLPPEKRRAITALYAFCREVDDVVDECSDAGVARAKLNWWRGEVRETYHGNPQHPVTRALQPVVRRLALPMERFFEIIDGMEMDLEKQGYRDFDELSRYCYRVASVVGLLSVPIFGYRNPQTLDYAHDLGMAFQLTNILRDVREDAARGRIYIPQEEMAKFGVTPAQLSGATTSEGARALFAAQAERARRYYRQAFEKLPAEDRFAQRSGIIMAEVYLALLDRIENSGYAVLGGRISLSPWRKLWIAWRTARREAKASRERGDGI